MLGVARWDGKPPQQRRIDSRNFPFFGHKRLSASTRFGLDGAGQGGIAGRQQISPALYFGKLCQFEVTTIDFLHSAAQAIRARRVARIPRDQSVASSD